MSKSLVITLDNSGKISARTLALLSGVVKKTAADIEAGAKARAPVDTGFLRTSIQSEMTGESEATISVGAEYGAFVEYGTRKTPAQPFLTPAVDAARPAFLAAIKTAGARGSA